MARIDISRLVPENIRRQILDALVGIGSDQIGKLLGDELATRFKKLRSDSAFKRKFDEGLQRAAQRFIEEYQAEDEELVNAIASNRDLFQGKDIQAALISLIKHPGSYLAETSRNEVVQSFASVLPEYKDRERIDRAMTHFIRCLAEELWHLPELMPIYNLQFQRLTAEATHKQVEMMKTHLQSQTQLNVDIRHILLQLANEISEQKALPPSESAGFANQLSQPHIYHNLPQSDFGRFVGREEELTQIHHLLRPYPYSQEYIVAIDGIGGVGKSALALEVAYYYLRNQGSLAPMERFDAIIWISAKQTVMTAEGVRQRPQAMRTLDDICAVIAITLQREDIIRAGQEERGQLVNRALSRQRTLLIVDNFESVDDESVVSFLHDLSEPTKILLTTRHKVDVAFPIRLASMPWEDAKELIAQEGKKKSVKLNDENARNLYDRTGGLPLAIVWSVAQMGFGYSIEGVLQRLREPSSNIAQFCFSTSMNRIRGKPSHKLLMALSLFANDASREALSYTTGLNDDRPACDDGLVELEKLSLVHRHEERIEIYHPFIREYINHEVALNVDFIEDSAVRQRQYFLTTLSTLLGTDYWDSYMAWRNYHILDKNLPTIEQIFHQLIHNGDWEAAIRVFNALVHYLSRKSRWGLRLQLVPYAIAAANKSGSKLMEAWYHIDSLGWILLQQNNLREALEHIEMGEAIASDLGFIDALALAASHRSQLLAIQGERKLSKDILTPFLSASISPVVRRHVLTYWAEQRLAEGDLAEAREKIEIARSICTEINDEAGLSYVLLVLANLHMSQGNFDSAFDTFHRIIDFEKQLDRSGVIARSQLGLAKLAVMRKDYALSLDLASQAADRFDRVGIEKEALEARAVAQECARQLRSS